MNDAVGRGLPSYESWTAEAGFDALTGIGI
jgi:hypothetical protein